MSVQPCDDFRQAPLVPAALAATAGVVLDRWAGVPLPLSLLGVFAGVAAWAAARRAGRDWPALVCLWAAVAALGAAYHHWHCEVVRADDIGHFAKSEPRPVVLQGVLTEKTTVLAGLKDPLRAFSPRVEARPMLRVRRLKQRDDWLEVSGLVRLSVADPLKKFHVGDEVKVVGRLVAPPGAANPGEVDYASYLRDQRIRALVQVERAPEGVTCLARSNWAGVAGSLAALRDWGHCTLEELLPKEQQGLAMALLLGEDWALSRAEWDKYQRTGVIHALAISGQHLVVLSGFAWLGLRMLQIPRRRGAWFVALFLLAYALLTGGRPPVMRAAATVCALAPSLLLRRFLLRTNSFALGWLTVLVINPTDIFNTGCQLSFLAVAILFWVVPRLTEREPDRLERLIAESRPGWQNVLSWLGRQVGLAYLVGLVIWLALAPLIATRSHLVSLVGPVIGPPVVLLTSVALLAGFLALLSAELCWPLAQLAGWVTAQSLAGCDLLASAAERWPAAYRYVADVPVWWLWIFYGGLLAALAVEPLRRRWRQLGIAGLVWLCVGLVSGAVQSRPAELRCTFLAVGHGGCAVLETPDGRTFLYDAGAISGPDVTRRCIAPYLWSRGVGRIDEVFLSHADLDHHNGLIALLERFAVGQVTCTPSFQDNSDKPGVRLLLEELQRRRIPLRMVCTGDRLTAGDLEMEVLHPPAVGPDGNENARSLVLLLSHCGHRILLTGDLQEPGLKLVLSRPDPPVEVLQAPHHGSKTSNSPELAAWARPKVVVSCQGPPHSPARGPDPYIAVGARLLTTWEHGAVTVRSSAAGLRVETYRTAERWSISR